MRTRNKKKQEQKGNGLVYVGMPRERFMFPEFIDNRDAILNAIQASGRYCGYFSANGHRVDRNRDSIVRAFMEHEKKPEWLLQLDTDMEHPVNIAEILVSRNKPVIGGLYFHRGEDHNPFIFRYNGLLKDKYGRMTPHWSSMRNLVYDFLIASGLPNVDGSFHVKNPPFDPVIECDAIATGAMLVHRSVFEKIEAPWFEYRDYGTSEDLMFCKLAKEAGFPVYCDMSVISGHYRSMPVGQAEFRSIFESMSVRATKFSKEIAIQDLAEYFNIPVGEAAKIIDEGSASVTSSYYSHINPQTDEEIYNFYRSPETGKLYVIELMYWNTSDAFTKLRSSLIKVRNSDILELGSGIGTIVCQLAMQMNKVYAFEPNEVTRGFMNMRVNNMMATPGIECIEPVILQNEEWWNDIEDNSLDFVMGFDVFEHIPLEELRNVIKHAVSKLKPGGRLLYHNNFKQQDLYPHHFDYTNEWKSIVEDAGAFQVSPMESVKKM